MLPLCFILIGVAFAVSLPATWIVRGLARRAQAFDSDGVAGQVKAERRRVPNVGGVAIFLGFTLPVLGVLGAVWLGGESLATGPLEPLRVHLAGLRERTPLALALLACLLLLHVMGLIDDRRPLGPWVKLLVMLVPAAAVSLVDQTRLLTMLDAYPGGMIASYAITVAWFIVVTNAMNFMDNMDGLAAGTTAIASACFLSAALINGQWFVAASLALLLGSVLGFLVFNFPPASIFMGDAGSLMLGFILAFLTVRTTYFGASSDARPVSEAWYAVLMPLVVLAVPLYDFASVVVIRLSQRRSPFVGDLQHLSHRLAAKGLSKRAAVAVIWGATGITGLSGILLGSLAAWQAMLVGAQVVLMLGVLAAFEYAGVRAAGRDAR